MCLMSVFVPATGNTETIAATFMDTSEVPNAKDEPLLVTAPNWMKTPLVLVVPY